MSHVEFPHLFSPIKVGPLVLKNRVVMAPLATAYAGLDGSVTPQLMEYYAARAAGGAAMIIVEFSYTDDTASKAQATQLGIHDDVLIPGLNELAERIRFEGALAGIQLCHCGLQRFLGTYPCVAPSRIPWFRAGAKLIPTELSVEEIRDIVKSFQAAAARAVRAGFDYVEVHGAHGYLIHSFFSPVTNRRTDVYGGSLVNRMRFALEVVEAVRSVVPEDVALGFRISGDEYVEGGFDADESEVAARELEKAGIDVLHVSASIHNVAEKEIPPMFMPRAMNVHLAARIRGKISIPVITVGAITKPELAEGIIAEGQADLIALGRPLVADPEYPSKAQAGRPETIRPCVRCNACVQRNREWKKIHCAVNFDAGREYMGKAEPARSAKRILVVGGGPGGLEAAARLAERSHSVILCERSNELGGRLIEAAVPPFKHELRELLCFLVDRTNRLPIDVRLNTIVDEAYVSGGEFDAVVLATGAEVARPSISFSSGVEVISTEQATFNPPRGKQVVVVGGGLVGSELAWHLGELGNRVVLTSRREAASIAGDMEISSRKITLSELKRLGVRVIGGVKLMGLSGESANFMDQKWNEMSLPCDIVVLASGFEPRNKLFNPIKSLGIVCFTIGDCLKPRKIYDAINEAAFVARKI